MRLLTSVLLLFNLTLFGQEKLDTLFMNSDYKTCTKEEAVYYRLITIDTNNIIKIEDYLINGIIQMKAHYTSLNPENKEGLSTYYSENGNPSSEVEYHNNKMNGIWKLFYTSENGAIRLKANYVNGVLEGERIGYYKNGTIKRSEFYNSGKMKSGKCFTANGADTVFYEYHQLASFPGGEDNLYKFLNKNINYPIDEKNKGISGTVYITFEVDTDGRIINIEKVLGVKNGIGCDNDAIRVIRLMPNWIPGKEDGELVKTRFNLPIRYTLR